MTGTKIAYKPFAQMHEYAVKIHRHAGMKAFTPAQTRAIQSFRYIYVFWVLGKSEFPGTGAWGVWSIARLIAAKLSHASVSFVYVFALLQYAIFQYDGYVSSPGQGPSKMTS
jgi:hypothetical protein